VIRAIVWKECREQRAVVAAVLAFGALSLYLTAQFADAATAGTLEGGGPRELMAIALAYLAGAVSGAILLADEKEVGTLEFLDALPCRRRAVWAGKVVAGGLLAVGQGVVLALLAVGLGSIDERLGSLAYGSLVVLVGVLSYAWGVFGGALARSTLGAVFLGCVASVATGLVLAVPFVVVFGARGFARPFGLPLIAYYACWVGAGLAGSAVLFTGVDRRRAAARRPARSGAGAGAGPGAGREPTPKPRLAGLRALSWLTVRQAVFVALGSTAAALVVGAVMLAPESEPLFIWPGVTLALGVLAGVTTVGEEQVRGVARFWAERRLPLGRLWLVKTGFHFALAVGAALVIGVFVIAASPAVPFRSRLTLVLRPEFGRFLFLGLVYGFVVGHLAAMLFRKTVVAGLVATVTAATLAGLIVPSMIGGGAAAWQVWGPAAVLLATARLLLYPWATDRVTTRGPVVRAAGGTALALAVLGAGLVYRVVEIPPAADRLAESGFADDLPSFEGNKIGRDVKGAAAQYRGAADNAQTLYPGARPAGGVRPRRGPTTQAGDPLARVARGGWTVESAALDPWLDRVFAADWPKALLDVADRPPGVYEDPRDLDYFTAPDSFDNLGEMTLALRARGMQRLAAGDPAAFPRLLRAGLAAARTGRYGGGLLAAATALECEQVLLGGVAEWLDRQDGGRDVLRDLLAYLARHEADMPVGTADAFWAEQIILRNTMDRIGSWLPRQLDPHPDRLDGPDARAEAESSLVAFAWHIPWERARRERLLRVQSGQRVEAGWLSALHIPARWRQGFEGMNQVADADRRGAALRRFARIQVAVRLFDLERGALPPDLAALVPDYLPAVPDDPYTGRPFGYRVSAGEPIVAGSAFPGREGYVGFRAAQSLAHPLGGLPSVWTILGTLNPVPARRGAPIVPPVGREQYVPPGVGILWSAGPDGRDDGGWRSGPGGLPAGAGDDWIVTVRPARRPGE
jgi:hypothetical protein